MDGNRRLKELKLSFYINYIDKAQDKILYSKIMKILSCLAGAIGKDEHTTFTKLTMASVGGNLLNATDKEIVATTKAFFSNRKAARLLGLILGITLLILLVLALRIAHINKVNRKRKEERRRKRLEIRERERREQEEAYKRDRDHRTNRDNHMK